MSKAIKEPTGQPPLTPGWQPPAETAPSVVRPDEPLLARVIGFVGLLLFVLGALVYVRNIMGREAVYLFGIFRFGPGMGVVFFITGVCGLLYHAAVDKDIQYRRTYGALGFAWLIAGFIFSLIPVRDQVGNLFLPYGLVSFTLGLLFLLPISRNEDDPLWQFAISRAVAGVGILLAVVGFIGGNVSADFLLTKGLPMGVLGLCFLWAYVGLQGAGSERGYYAGLGIGAAGALVFLVALGRSVLPPLLHSWGWVAERPAPYLVPQGLLLMALGLAYVGLALGICSDSTFLVLLRRELASFFYSPIAYIVLFGMMVVAWYLYLQFFNRLLIWSDPQRFLRFANQPDDPLVEPVVQWYVQDWAIIISMVFVVPVLTMRLLSEEKRTGTLEVMFTAPVREATVVLSKFFAAFLVFLVAWLPLALFLVSLRVEGGRDFDYRPMLSFYLALACSGAGFIAMGVFFSSLTRNQVASAILTFVGMLVMTVVFIFNRAQSADSAWGVFLTHISYIDLWLRSLEGVVVPRLLVFHLSMAVFWLFLTTKVLEARRWS
jgi:ABC-type transport system involved in multi-copper enzyme maturation permease subunit